MWWDVFMVYCVLYRVLGINLGRKEEQQEFGLLTYLLGYSILYSSIIVHSFVCIFYEDRIVAKILCMVLILL